MSSPLEIYNEWQRRQYAREFEHLGEVVDLEGFRDICIGLSDWTTGYQAAFENLTRNILTRLCRPADDGRGSDRGERRGGSAPARRGNARG